MKTNRLLTFLSMFTLISCSSALSKRAKAQDPVVNGLVPLPSYLNYTLGYFLLTGKTTIEIASEENTVVNVGGYLSGQIKYLTGLNVTTETNTTGSRNPIVLSVINTDENPDGYTLKVKKEKIEISGNGPSGVFYGVQTLLQLIYPQNENSGAIHIPCADITDKPAFAWRGMHLDVCRHFYSAEEVKKMLDMMATLKLNVFHWHLTEDQGWRIEIKRYPKLTEIGAWRDSTMTGHFNNEFDHMRYGGYYTQEEIRDVVKYAQSRYITIVPEIEMPGHAVAALSAYPEYSCTGGPFKVRTGWGISKDVYCAGNDKTFEFLENILDEVVTLFPGEYIHIGGDECPKDRWHGCSLCQKRMKDKGLKDELELQSYFVKRIEKYIASKGKKLIGWDEILEGGLPERATVMSWRGTKGGIEAAHTGHDVVMTPTQFCYFDYCQDTVGEPDCFGNYNPLENVYSFKPVTPELTVEESKHILGGQANIWTEFIDSPNKLEYMAFPRLCAMAEVLWTPEDKQNYQQFLKRLEPEISRLEKYRVNFRSLDK